MFLLANPRRSIGARVRLILATALTLLGCSKRPDNQALTDRPPPVWCQECRITLAKHVTVGRPSDSVGVQFFSHLAGTPSGAFVVAPIGDGAQIGEYDQRGQLVQVFGAAGGAPGEYDLIRDLAIGASDTGFVLDQHRLTLLDPERVALRSSVVPAGVRASRLALLADGRLVLNDYGREQKEFVIVDRAARLVNQFGAGTRHPGYDPEHLQYVLSASPDSGFWAAKVVAPFTVAHFNSDGKVLRAFDISAPWLESSEVEEPRGQDPRSVRPTPRVGDAWFDGRGLWLSVLVPDSKWKPMTPTASPGRESSGAMPSPGEWTDIYDTVIAVLDPETQSIVATIRRDEVFAEFTGSGQLWTLVEAENGALTIDVFKLALTN